MFSPYIMQSLKNDHFSENFKCQNQNIKSNPNISMSKHFYLDFGFWHSPC